MVADNWSREELILAFNLYCKTSFGKIHNRNPEIVALAKLLDRSPSAVSWKLANFARLDPSLKDRNIVGASHGSKLDQEVWNEFNGNWPRLAFESERLFAQKTGQPIESLAGIDIADLPRAGKEREALVRVRVNQGFFRKAVLAAYRYRCCITGLEIPELLNASHIIPWSRDEANRVNPRNGLCLNAFHDRAFDRGLVTITPEFTVKVSPAIMRKAKNSVALDFLARFDGCSVELPGRFVPDPKFIKYHNKHVYRSI